MVVEVATNLMVKKGMYTQASLPSMTLGTTPPITTAALGANVSGSTNWIDMEWYGLIAALKVPI